MSISGAADPALQQPTPIQGETLKYSESTHEIRVIDKVVSHVRSLFSFLLFKVPMACWSGVKQITMFPFWGTVRLVRAVTYPFWSGALANLEAQTKADMKVEANAALSIELDKARDKIQLLSEQLSKSRDKIESLVDKLAKVQIKADKKVQDMTERLAKAQVRLEKAQDVTEILAEELSKSHDKTHRVQCSVLAEESVRGRDEVDTRYSP